MSLHAIAGIFVDTIGAWIETDCTDVSKMEVHCYTVC